VSKRVALAFATLLMDWRVIEHLRLHQRLVLSESGSVGVVKGLGVALLRTVFAVTSAAAVGTLSAIPAGRKVWSGAASHLHSRARRDARGS